MIESDSHCLVGVSWERLGLEEFTTQVGLGMELKTSNRDLRIANCTVLRSTEEAVRGVHYGPSC